MSISYLRAAQSFHEKLIKLSGIEGQVVFPELSKSDSEIDSTAVEKMFSNFYTSRYRQFIATLKFGTELTSQVTISPMPMSTMIQQNFEDVEVEMEPMIDLQGIFTFIPIR